MSLSYSTQIILSLVFLYLLYKYFTRSHSYWKRKGVPYIQPKLFFGNYYDILTMKKAIGVKLAEMYNEMEVPYFGTWVFDIPHFIVKSPDLINEILIKDFKYFQDRNMVANIKADPMNSIVLFALKNPEWKIIRSKMTPAFSSSKIKAYLPLINNVAEDLKLYLSKQVLHNDNIEAHEVCTKYSTDVITTCAFGVEGHSFESEDAPWRAIGKQMFEPSFSNGVRGVAYFFLPNAVKFFKIKFIPSNVTNFLKKAFCQTIERREKENCSRNDLIDILINLKRNPDLGGIKFEGNKVVAQAVQFFLAGFETIGTTIANTLYELCLNRSIQVKLIYEIKQTLEKYGEVTHESIQNMKYLDKVLQETLRKYPVLPFLDRKCIADYKVPGTDILLEKGTPVFVSILGLHHLSEYYPNPNVFDPERFSEENINARPSCAYLPFGAGPRSCIGERLGLLIAKVALIHILSQFEVYKSAETPVQVDFEPKTFLLSSKIGYPLRFVDTKQNSPFKTYY